MQKYELTLVLDGEATSAKKKSIEKFVNDLVATLKGKLGSPKDWGQKPLAFKIGKSTNGIYLFFPIELEKELVVSFQNKIKIKDGIIRYLLVTGT